MIFSSISELLSQCFTFVSADFNIYVPQFLHHLTELFVSISSSVSCILLSHYNLLPKVYHHFVSEVFFLMIFLLYLYLCVIFLHSFNVIYIKFIFKSFSSFALGLLDFFLLICSRFYLYLFINNNLGCTKLFSLRFYLFVLVVVVMCFLFFTPMISFLFLSS